MKSERWLRPAKVVPMRHTGKPFAEPERAESERSRTKAGAGDVLLALTTL